MPSKLLALKEISDTLSQGHLAKLCLESWFTETELTNAPVDFPGGPVVKILDFQCRGMGITTNCGKFLKRWEYQITWPASWETCMQVRKQQLELDMEQQTGSK